jgi:hypothetical protein
MKKRSWPEPLLEETWQMFSVTDSSLALGLVQPLEVKCADFAWQSRKTTTYTIHLR